MCVCVSECVAILMLKTHLNTYNHFGFHSYIGWDDEKNFFTTAQRSMIVSPGSSL